MNDPDNVEVARFGTGSGALVLRRKDRKDLGVLFDGVLSVAQKMDWLSDQGCGEGGGSSTDAISDGALYLDGMTKLMNNYDSVESEAGYSINTLAHWDPDGLDQDLSWEDNLVVVLVEKRLLEAQVQARTLSPQNVTTASYDPTQSYNLAPHLLTFRKDINQTVCDFHVPSRAFYRAVLIVADVYAGPLHRDGRTLLALRSYLKVLRVYFKNLRGAILVGAFPEALLVRRWGNGGEHEEEIHAFRSDIVLGDLDGNWGRTKAEPWSCCGLPEINWCVPKPPIYYARVEDSPLSGPGSIQWIQTSPIKEDFFLVDDAWILCMAKGLDGRTYEQVANWEVAGWPEKFCELSAPTSATGEIYPVTNLYVSKNKQASSHFRAPLKDALNVYISKIGLDKLYDAFFGKNVQFNPIQELGWWGKDKLGTWSKGKIVLKEIYSGASLYDLTQYKKDLVDFWIGGYMGHCIIPNRNNVLGEVLTVNKQNQTVTYGDSSTTIILNGFILEGLVNEKKMPLSEYGHYKVFNTMAVPNILVSRICARNVATEFSSFPTTPATRYDPYLERELMIRYFVRNHNYRTGLYSESRRCSGVSYGWKKDEDWEPLNLTTAFAEFWEGKPVQMINCKDVVYSVFNAWLLLPAILRTISTHGYKDGGLILSEGTKHYNSRFGKFRYYLPFFQKHYEETKKWDKTLYTISKYVLAKLLYYILNNEKEMKIEETMDELESLINVFTSLKDKFNQAGSFYWVLGSYANAPYHSDIQPYNAWDYGRNNTSECLLFYAEGLSILSRAHSHYDSPGTFQNPISTTLAEAQCAGPFDLLLSNRMTFGEIWRGNFEYIMNTSDRTEIYQRGKRKDPYRFGIIGDWTLRLNERKPPSVAVLASEQPKGEEKFAPLERTVSPGNQPVPVPYPDFGKASGSK